MGTVILITNFSGGVLKNKKEINLRDKSNLKQGIWLSFYKGFEIKSEVNYLNGLKHGYEKTFKPNGNLIEIVKYSSGVQVTGIKDVVQVSIKSKLSNSGKIVQSGVFDEKGIPYGIHRTFSDSGKVIASKIFKDGKTIGEGIVLNSGLKNGMWKTFYENGNIKSEGKYINNIKVGEWNYYFKNGLLNQKGNYLLGKEEGEWNWYFKSGKLHKKEFYIDGLQDGILTEYNDSGKIITTGNFKQDFKEGKWIYEVGDHKEIGVYKNDLQEGEWIYYYKNEQIMFKGFYKNDLETGRHNYWYENGVLKKFGNYLFGKKIGDWYYYNSSGVLILITKFEEGIEREYNGFKFEPEHEFSDYVD